MKKTMCIGLAMSAVVLACLSAYQYTVIHSQSLRLESMGWRNTYVREEQKFVDRAFVDFAPLANQGPETLAMNFYALVVPVGEEVCVRLRPEPPSVGISPVYCYDVHTSKPTRSWSGL